MPFSYLAQLAAPCPSSPHPAHPTCPPCRRSSLLDYVRERKRLPEPEAVRIFQQLLHSLQFCHRKDVSGAVLQQQCCVRRQGSLPVLQQALQAPWRCALSV